jgi:cystathionine gamma-synthase
MTLNPKGRHYTSLKQVQNLVYEDIYFDEDAIFLERNSRDFRSRILKINQTAEALCDFFWAEKEKSKSGGGGGVIKDVYYPKFVTTENYRARLRSPPSEGGESSSSPSASPGFGGLFSLTFTSARAAEYFYDALPCPKGPSLGTNFTLASPYTILAHYAELDWAVQWGVEPNLVRVSVGLEDLATLRGWFEGALREAEKRVSSSASSS